MPSTPLFNECSKACHRGTEGASDCMSSIKVYIQIHLTCNQEVRRWFKLIMIDMTAHCFLYGEFLPTLYFTPTCDYVPTYLPTHPHVTTFYLHMTILYTHIFACILHLHDCTLHLHVTGLTYTKLYSTHTCNCSPHLHMTTPTRDCTLHIHTTIFCTHISLCSIPTHSAQTWLDVTASPVCSQPLFPTPALSLSSSVDSLAPAWRSNRTTRGSLGAGSVELSLSSQSNPSTCLGLANMKSISLFQQANKDVN